MIERGSRVSFACNNWYIKDNGLVEIFDQKGQHVLLDNIQKKIWCEINYENSVDEIFNKLSSNLTYDELISILEEFMELDLIFVISNSDEDVDFLFL